MASDNPTIHGTITWALVYLWPTLPLILPTPVPHSGPSQPPKLGHMGMGAGLYGLGTGAGAGSSNNPPESGHSCLSQQVLKPGLHAQVLGTPSKEDICSMNPNYTDFKFPQIKAHPWGKVFSKRMPGRRCGLGAPADPQATVLHCPGSSAPSTSLAKSVWYSETDGGGGGASGGV